MNSFISSHKKITSFLCFFWVILLFSACSSNQNKGKKNAAKAGVPTDSLSHDPYSAPLHVAAQKATATDFETQLLNGDSFQLSNQKGKVVLLNIWATWCPPCEEETPALEAVFQDFKSKDIVFLGISIDEQGESVVKPFIKKHNVSYPITIDDGTIMDKYGPLMGIPTTYILDKQGNLAYFATGAITQEELEPRLQKLLNSDH